MQRLLDLLNTECFRIGLQINVDKTVHTVISKCTSHYPIRMYCNGELIPFTSDLFIYLGSLFNVFGSMHVHVDAKCDAAMRAFGAVLNIWKRFPFLTLLFKLEMLNVLVFSVSNFASSVWIWQFATKIDWLATKLLRFSLGVSARVSGDAIRWLLARQPLSHSLFVRAFDFWISVAAMSEQRYESRILHLAWELFFQHKTGWIASMLRIFDQYGFIDHISQALDIAHWDATTIKSHRTRFTKCLRQWNQQILHDKLVKSSKYEFLLFVRPLFCEWPVIKLDLHFSLLRALCKFLLSDHGLEIETGR